MRMNKKNILLSIILTLFFVISPAFLVDLARDNSEKEVGVQKYEDDISINNEEDKEYKNINVKGSNGIDEYTLSEDVTTTFSSGTSFKKTYYINTDKVNMYKDSEGKEAIPNTLKKNDAVIAYIEENGYLYCEDNFGNFGWIKETSKNLTGIVEKYSKYKIDISLSKQNLTVYRDNKIVKSFICSTGKIGDPYTETPIGIFTVQLRGTSFYNDKYKQGAKYYIKFFSTYLIHSIPTDKKNNIIKEEEKKLGFPVSHGCIRIGMNESKWLYDNIPDGSLVVIHY